VFYQEALRWLLRVGIVPHNKPLQPTPYSVRSCVAPASGRGWALAFGCIRSRNRAGQRRTLAHRRRIVDFATQHWLPMIAEVKPFAEAGGLMTYGIDLLALYRRAAYYVDSILKGRKPADLPVEQPRTFAFVINLKTAQSLGLTLPPHLLYFADEVLQ
jgi:hypothetical protein